MIVGCQEGAEVVIEPPCDFGRGRIFEVDDGVLVARKVGFVEEGSGAVHQAAKLVGGIGADALVVKAAEQGGRAGAVKTFVVIEDPNLQDNAAPRNRQRRNAGRESLSLPGRREVSSQDATFLSIGNDEVLRSHRIQNSTDSPAREPGGLRLTGRHGYSRSSSMRFVFSRPRLRWASVLGIVCIALVLMSGMVQAAHFHAQGGADHDCALCVAAHHVANATTLITLDFSSLPVAPLTAASTLVMPRRAVFFRFFSRPPPSGSAPLA
jgi:hypothetical protein